MTTFMPVAGAGGLDSLLSGLMGTGTVGTTGAATGLSGLFGALVGAEGQGTVDPTALLAALGQGATTGEGTAEDLLPLLQTLDLGEGLKLELQGAGVDIAVLQQRITEVTVILQEAGIDLTNMGSAGEFAQALIIQGMDPEEAIAKATALENMLAMMKQKLELKDGEETGALAVLLLAGAMQPLPVQKAVTITIRHEEQTLVMVNKSFLAGQMTGAYGNKANSSGGDVVAHLLAGVKEVADKDKEAVDLLAAVENTAAAQVAAIPAEAKPVVATHVPNEVPVAAVEVQAAHTAAPKILHEVADEDVLADVDGEVMFKMREGRDGALTVEATPAAGKVLEQQMAIHQNGESVMFRNSHKEAVPVQGAWPFADHVAAAAKAKVGEQAVVQIKSLVDGGGGTVKMILNPPELGEVRIELVIKNGEVSGTMSASDVAVVQELSRDLAGLKQTFADAGLKLGQEGLNVALNQQNQQDFNHQQQAQQAHEERMKNQAGTNGASGSAEEAVTATTTAGRWVRPDSLVDVEI